MNEKDLHFPKPRYYVGQLVKIRNTSNLALVTDLRDELLYNYDSGPYGPGPSYLYQLHICGDNTVDSRWLPEALLQKQ